MNYSDILIKNNNSGSFHSTCLEHLWQKSLLGNDLIVLWLTHLLEASHIHRIVEVKSSWRGSVMQSHFQVSPKTFCWVQVQMPIISKDFTSHGPRVVQTLSSWSWILKAGKRIKETAASCHNNTETRFTPELCRQQDGFYQTFFMWHLTSQATLIGRALLQCLSFLKVIPSTHRNFGSHS